MYRVPGFADQLGHGAHRAVDAPATGLEEDHRHQAQHGGSEHDAVEAEGKLGHAGVEQRAVVGPLPGKLEGPQQGDDLLEILGAGKDQPGVPEHHEEHHKEKGQKAVAECLAFHPAGNIVFAGQPEPAAQQSKELAPAAIAVAVRFAARSDRDDQRQKETGQTQPGKQDVEKSQHQVEQ